MHCRSSCFTSRGHHLLHAKHQGMLFTDSGASVLEEHAVGQLDTNFEQPVHPAAFSVD